MTDSKLLGLHPVLQDKVTRILGCMSGLEHPMVVTDGLRTLEQQQALYAIGRTAPGRIVTFCDGVRRKSNHQAQDDGYGHAADLAFLVDGKPNWDGVRPWAFYGQVAKLLGLKWGGDFTSLVDRPHVEL